MTQVRKFKIDDRVICMNSEDSPLRTGGVYKVIGIIGSKKRGEYLRLDKHGTAGYRVGRFSHADSEPEKPVGLSDDRDYYTLVTGGETGI